MLFSYATKRQANHDMCMCQTKRNWSASQASPQTEWRLARLQAACSFTQPLLPCVRCYHQNCSSGENTSPVHVGLALHEAILLFQPTFS